MNISNSDSSAIAYITYSLDTDIVNPLGLNLKMSHSNLYANMKSDIPERKIHLQATTRGDNKVNKQILVVIKKACNFITPTSFEYVFDHGYAGDTYGLSELVQVIDASTANFVQGSTHQ